MTCEQFIKSALSEDDCLSYNEVETIMDDLHRSLPFGVINADTLKMQVAEVNKKSVYYLFGVVVSLVNSYGGTPARHHALLIRTLETRLDSLNYET